METVQIYSRGIATRYPGAPVSKNQRSYRMPPGLKTQIAFAVLITLCAIFVLPTALSANTNATSSAGSVKTTLRDFKSGDFSPSAYADWD